MQHWQLLFMMLFQLLFIVLILLTMLGFPPAFPHHSTLSLCSYSMHQCCIFEQGLPRRFEMQNHHIKQTTGAQFMNHYVKPTINYILIKQWHIIHTFYYYHATLLESLCSYSMNVTCLFRQSLFRSFQLFINHSILTTNTPQIFV